MLTIVNGAKAVPMKDVVERSMTLSGVIYVVNRVPIAAAGAFAIRPDLLCCG